ncbi:MAG: hypothetical protein Q9181_006639 [Wetmoreana brouardii]
MIRLSDCGTRQRVKKCRSSKRTLRALPRSQACGLVQTPSSARSSQELIGAAEELANLLSEDETLENLYGEALQKITAERFERNLRRLIRKFAINLKREANTILERNTAQFVRLRAAYVASCIIRNISPTTRVEVAHASGLASHSIQREEMIERYLQQQLLTKDESIEGLERNTHTTSPLDGSVTSVLPSKAIVKTKAGDEHYSSSEDSEIPLEDRAYLPNLKGVQAFILESSAMQNLRNDVLSFIRPADHPLPAAVLSPAAQDLEVPEPADLESGASSTGDLSRREELPREVSSEEEQPTMSVDNTELSSESISDPSLPHKTESHQIQPSTQRDSEDAHVLNNDVKLLRWEKCILCVNQCLAIFLNTCWHIAEFLELIEKPLASDLQRIRWTCVCGTRLFDDFREISPGYVGQLQDYLNGTGSCLSTNDMSPIPETHARSELTEGESSGAQIPQGPPDLEVRQ